MHSLVAGLLCRSKAVVCCSKAMLLGKAVKQLRTGRFHLTWETQHHHCWPYRKHWQRGKFHPDATKGHHRGFVVLQVQRFDAGERQRYFADDDKQQLGDLVAQQRYEGAADIDANLVDNIVRKGKRFRWA